MKKIFTNLVNIILSVLIVLGILLYVYNFVPIKNLGIEKSLKLGTALTTINLTDTVKNALYTTANNNFTALNNAKLESGSSASLLTIASSTIASLRFGSLTGTTTDTSTFGGSLTIGNILTVSGSGTSTFTGGGSFAGLDTSKGITIGSGYGAIKSLSTATSSFQNGISITGGCVLWNSSCLIPLNLTQSNVWTASTTFSGSPLSFNASTISLNGVPYTFPTTQGASSTVLKNNGSGNLINSSLDWDLLSATTTNSTNCVATSTVPSRNYYRVIIDSKGFAAGSNTVWPGFNGDNGNNYGFRTKFGESTGNNSVLSNYSAIGFGDTATTTRSVIIVDVTNNPISVAKTVIFNGTQYSVNVGAIAPTTLAGSGIWNNTSSGITSIEVGSNAGFPISGTTCTNTSFNAGLTLTVYGSKD